MEAVDGSVGGEERTQTGISSHAKVRRAMRRVDVPRVIYTWGLGQQTALTGGPVSIAMEQGPIRAVHASRPQHVLAMDLRIYSAHTGRALNVPYNVNSYVAGVVYLT